MEKNNQPPSGDKKGGATREMPLVRHASVFVRAAHLWAAALILGGAFAGEPLWNEKLLHALVALSGLGLLAAEWLRHPMQHRELSGFATFIKIGLIVIAAILGKYQALLFTIVMVLGALSSHASRKWRRKRLF